MSANMTEWHTLKSILVFRLNQDCTALWVINCLSNNTQQQFKMISCVMEQYCIATCLRRHLQNVPCFHRRDRQIPADQNICLHVGEASGHPQDMTVGNAKGRWKGLLASPP
jgi:hypothetical protein